MSPKKEHHRQVGVHSEAEILQCGQELRRFARLFFLWSIRYLRFFGATIDHRGETVRRDARFPLGVEFLAFEAAFTEFGRNVGIFDTFCELAQLPSYQQ